MHDAILGPALIAGLSVEAGLVERMVADAGTGHGSLPLVAHLLRALFDASPDGALASLGEEDRGRARSLLLSWCACGATVKTRGVHSRGPKRSRRRAEHGRDVVLRESRPHTVHARARVALLGGAGALAAVARAKVLLSPVDARDPDDLRNRAALAEACEAVAAGLHLTGRDREAVTAAERAAAFWAELSRANPDNHTWRVRNEDGGRGSAGVGARAVGGVGAGPAGGGGARASVR